MWARNFCSPVPKTNGGTSRHVLPFRRVTSQKRPTIGPSHSGRLTSTDASFLYLEREHAPMHIGAVAILDGELPFEPYLRSVEAKLARLPRFRERIVAAPMFLGHPTWETSEDFDIHDHIELHHVAQPGGEAEFHELVNRLIAPRMDRSKPLWKLHIIHGLESGDSAIVSMVHHAMVDGVGGNQILTTILDLFPDAPTRPPAEVAYEPTVPPGRGGRIREALWDQARETVDAFSDYQRKMLELSRDAGFEQIRTTLDVLRQSMPQMALPPKRLPFNKSCKGEKSFVWTRFSFSEAREIRSALGGTVNDVILACLGDAVGRYCRTHGHDTLGRTMRVMVPVNLRPEAAGADLGNLVSVLPVEIPIHDTAPRNRVGLIRESTRTLKRGRVAEGVGMMTHLMGAVPVPFQAAFGSMAVSPFPVFNMVCTNVPGPQIPLYAAGHRLKEYYPYVPTGFDMGVGCAIFSYSQMLHIGFNSDTHACPDVELLRDCFDDAVIEMKREAGVGDIVQIQVGRRDQPRVPEKKTGPPTRRKASAKKKKKKKNSATAPVDKKTVTKKAVQKKAAKKKAAKKTATRKTATRKTATRKTGARAKSSTRKR
jgi:WS/DGAT/MGAT family acyltransferase